MLYLSNNTLTPFQTKDFPLKFRFVYTIQSTQYMQKVSLVHVYCVLCIRYTLNFNTLSRFNVVHIQNTCYRLCHTHALMSVFIYLSTKIHLFMDENDTDVRFI